MVERKRHIYTVTELTRKIKVVLEEKFLQLWVEGEVSGVSPISTGTIFFTLKDDKAQLKCVIFAAVAKSLKFKLENGMQILCFGNISVFERDGRYQFYPQLIQPKGIGALQLAFEQLKERLAKEGLFDQKYKKEIPFLPQRIGIITSPTGAAIRDILHVLRRRFANLEIIVNPVRVQGEGAASEIAQALDQFNQFGAVDVLIVGRGGGSLEDLWAFNEEIVARAIFRSEIPVISAVGHEIDYTISDFVADLRAPTPSAAAEQVVVHKQELLDKLTDFNYRAHNAIVTYCALLQERLESQRERYAFKQPTDLVQQYQQTIDLLASTLDFKIRHIWEIYQEKYNVLIGKLDALSPLQVLLRGFSISLRLPEEKAITNAYGLKVDTKVKTYVARGAFISKVEEILKNSK